MRAAVARQQTSSRRSSRLSRMVGMIGGYKQAVRQLDTPSD